MLKNITFSAEEQIIEAARARARDEKTTLNEKFRAGSKTMREKKRRVSGVSRNFERPWKSSVTLNGMAGNIRAKR